MACGLIHPKILLTNPLNPCSDTHGLHGLQLYKNTSAVNLLIIINKQKNSSLIQFGSIFNL